MHVYIIQSGDYSKVGLANNPQSRLAALQTANPQALKLIYSKPFASRKDAKKAEAAMHKKFGYCRVQGEWFKTDPEKLKRGLDRMAEKPVKTSKSKSGEYFRRTAKQQQNRVKTYLAVNASTDKHVEINKDTILCLMTSGLGLPKATRQMLGLPYPLGKGWKKKTYGKWIPRKTFLSHCDYQLKQLAKA